MQIVDGNIGNHTVHLQEAIKLVARFQPEHATQLCLGDVASLVFFKREAFKRAAR